MMMSRFVESGVVFVVGGGINDLSITIQESDTLVHHEIPNKNLIKLVKSFAKGKEPRENKEKTLKNVDDDHYAEEELDREGVDEVINGGFFVGMHMFQPNIFLMQIGAEIAAMKDGEIEEECGGDGEFPTVGDEEELTEERDAEVKGNGHRNFHAEEETVHYYEDDSGKPRYRVFQEPGHEKNRPVRVGDDR